MATLRLGVSPNQSLENVVEAVGQPTVANVVELTIDQSAALVTDIGGPRAITKAEALICVELFKDYLVRRNWT